MFKFFKEIFIQTPFKEGILPFDVRYALQYKGGILNQTEIKILAENNFENEACFLFLKSLRDDPLKHKEFLQKYCDIIIEQTEENTKSFLRELIIKTLAEKQNDVKIEAGKLAQLSRQDFDWWRIKFKSLAYKLSESEKNIFLIAHTTLMGLPYFLKAFQTRNKNLYIIVPQWENNKIGYSINFTEKNKVILHWFFLPSEKNIACVLVDDTQNTGETLKKVSGILKRANFLNIETITLNKT